MTCAMNASPPPRRCWQSCVRAGILSTQKCWCWWTTRGRCTVEGTTFTHLAALIRVRDIEKNLAVQSYQGEGVGYVIDSNGYYVVNIYRSHNFMTRENFFDDIKGRSFSNYGSVEEIKAELAKGTKSFATTMKKDNDRIVVFRNEESRLHK